MIRGEVVCKKEDKEKLISLVGEIREILNKYPYSTEYGANTVTSMTLAKNSCDTLERNIRLLSVEKIEVNNWR